jgi:hypothetical protein
VKSKYTGTWRIIEMEAWDADYINLAGPGYITIDREGRGSMQFGVVEAALDCRIEQIAHIERLEFTFQGIDEEEAISGRGWVTVSGREMTGRICFHRGEDSGFTATKATPSKVSGRSTPKVIRLPQRLDTARTQRSPAKGTARKIHYGQPVEIRFSRAEKTLLEEHTLIDSEYMDRLQPCNSGKTWTGEYNLDDLEDILGYLGDGESHAEDKKIARRLGTLSSRLSKELDSYDDGG